MSKLHLLLLEEDTERAEQIRNVFEGSTIGYNVSHVDAHADFLTAVESEKHDVILSGNFSEQEGVTRIIREIKNNGRNIPYVIITNPINEEFAISLMKAGTFNYVLKERLEKLPGAILHAIEKYHLSEKREQFLNDILPREAMMKEAERLAHFGSWKANMQTNVVWWSDEQYRILGYEPGEVAASWGNFIKKVHPDDADLTTVTIDETIKNGDRNKHVFRIVDGQHTIRYIHSEIFVTRDADFNVIQLNGFMRDMSDHVEAELRSVENAEKYYSLFENNPCALVVLEIDTHKLLDVNKVALAQSGYTKEEFLRMRVSDFMPEDEYGRYLEIKNEFASGIDYKETWKLRKKGGGFLYSEITSSDIIFEGKQCRLILSNDITEKLESINKLKEREQQLINSQRIAHIGSWEVSLDGSNAVKWSEETYRIFGFEPDEISITQDLFLSIVHPKDIATLDAAMSNALNNGGYYSAEFRILLRDGSERLVSELGEMIFHPVTGKPLKITGTAQDITERRNARVQLQKSEANLRSIFENTDTAYVLLDTGLRIVSFNKPAYKFSIEHLSKEIAEGEHAIAYFSDTTLAVVKKSLREALNGVNLSYEVCYPDGKGNDKWYYAHFHPVWGDEENILGVIMSLRDITERKTLELKEKKITEDLLRRNKDLEQFAYIISHNLRAPVANIIGITDALKDDDLEPDEKTIFMDGMHDSAKKLDSVITDINRILQLKHGLSENKELVQLSALVHDIKFTIGGSVVTDMFQIKTDFAEVDEMITLKSYLHSIFYNLISNSIKYKRPDLIPVIEIVSRKTSQGIDLIFTDNGLGIDLEKNGAMLFGLYKRFHNYAAEGKGMGLYMVKTQVETLGGKISVKSRVNHGTEFKIEFSL